MKINQNSLVWVAAVISLAIGFAVFKSTETDDFNSTTFVYEPQRVIQPFELTDHQNNRFTNDQLKDQWSFVFLGYLSCPDVCPMTMAKLSNALPKMQELTDNNAKVLFVSVDPKRDQSADMAQYVAYFSPDIVGLRGEHKHLFPFVRNLGLMYSVPDQAADDGYYVDHSASIILINPQGQIAAIFKPEIELNQVPTVNMDTLLEDFKKLL